MTTLNNLLNSQPHSWHDALIAIVLIVVFTLSRVLIVLAKRVTYVSMPERKLRFLDRN